MCNLSDVIEKKGLEKGKETTLYDLIQSGLITPEVGAKKLSVSLFQLAENMKKAGFSFPK